ncbi:MAG: fibronectin type III-like domain-contianing protein [Thomasclavelia spiroformis]
MYLQKPYTEYDKQNNIEKASVELVGFAKTKSLKPNEEQTLKVTIKEKDLTSYDSYNKKTYILEKGDYYLATGLSSMMH